MTGIISPRRCLLTGLALALLGGGLVMTAPTAAAATTTSCAGGSEYLYPYTIDLGDACSGFVDNGGPYVFHISVLYNWQRVGFDILLVGSYSDVTARCGAYAYVDSTDLEAIGCAITS